MARCIHFAGHRCGLLAVAALVLITAGQALGQEASSGPAPIAATSQPSAASSPVAAFGLPNRSPSTAAGFYGGWALAPALLAIVLAIVTRQVIVALSLGVLAASGMICVLRGDYNPLHFVTTMMDRYVLGVLTPIKGGRVDLEHITILIYTLFIGAMIGVLSANGGTRALVERVTRRVRSRRAAQVGAFVAGLLVFIDDYASAMIVGPGLRPVFDRLRISREKLAHIVNWTAAPVSSMFLSTWLAVQMGWMDDGMDMLGERVPDFLKAQNASNIFWATIPYRTYCLLALAMLVLLALTGRDLGAMRKAERAALGIGGMPGLGAGPVRESPTDANSADRIPDSQRRWYLAAIPGFVLVAMTVGLMAQTGYIGALNAGKSLVFDSAGAIWSSLRFVFGNSDSHFALLYASLASAVLAIVLTVATRSLTLARTMEGAVSGMTAMFAATIILVLAWGLSAASKELQLGPVAEAFLRRQIDEGRFSLTWLPMSIFATACVISFSTGTSWGTMAILLPPVITISAGLLTSLPAANALTMFYGCVGAAMAGAVFGNTCSPLADVTVLSATFSGCDLAAHVRTILPQALIVAVVSVLSTDGVSFALAKWAPHWQAHWNVWYSLLIGVLLLLLIVLVLGRRPTGLVVEPAVELGG